MKRVAIVISHIPNPRILKRIKVLENNFNISLIYWDRGQKQKETFEINQKHTIQKILLKAPLGSPARRIIPLIRYTFKVINSLKKEKPDIIHVTNMDMLFIATIYQQIFYRNVKIVYEVADLPRYSFAKKISSLKTLIFKILQKLEIKMCNNISKLILTSPYFWREYFSKFISEDKYLFIPNVPSRHLFTRYQKKNHDNFTIGFIGSVRYIEQLKMLIDAVSELNKNIKVFIAGGGPNYEEIANYCKYKTFVEIYGPYNYEKEIVGLYERIDCTYSVYDTKLENVKIALPNRLYESIVCEIPIIGAKGTELGRFIEENKIGFTIACNDKEELKQKLVELINSKERLNYYQKNCEKIKYDYYYENYSKKLIESYMKLI